MISPSLIMSRGRGGITERVGSNDDNIIYFSLAASLMHLVNSNQCFCLQATTSDIYMGSSTLRMAESISPSVYDQSPCQEKFEVCR